MEQIKRQRKISTEGSDDMKRKQFHGAHQSEDSFDINLSLKSHTYFEDLSNELIYEIFEYFDFHYIYETFSNLNQRFINLIMNSNLPIKINVSSISKPNFQRYYTDIIIPYRQRIKSLRITNIFATNIILSSQDNISKLTRLETLICTNIPSSYLRNLQYLINLPNLSSLTIISDGYTNTDQAEVYHQIFQLPTLRYCNVLLGIDYESVVSSLPFATNKYSLIEHLVIKNYIQLDTLYIILSYVPQIRRLSIPFLLKPKTRPNTTFSTTLNNLTYISLKLSLNFDQFELLAKDIFHNLRVLRLDVSDEITYLDANRWENLILSHIPNLTMFDFQYIYFGFSKKNMISIYENLIKKFTSSFWIERQWFFSTQYPDGENVGDLVFFSVKPYKYKINLLMYNNLSLIFFRRTTFILCGIIEEKLNFDSVHHIDIENLNAINSCRNYFPNATKLTFSYDSNSICNSMDSSLPHIISPEQLTELIVSYEPISFMELIKLLSVAVNIHTVTLQYVSIDEINPVTIQQNVIFQLVSKTNVVKNLTLISECSLEKVELLFALCPRLQHFALHHDFTPFLIRLIRLILSKTNNNNRHLSSLCISKETDETEEMLKMVIQNDKLLDDYMMECVDNKVYVWW